MSHHQPPHYPENHHQPPYRPPPNHHAPPHRPASNHHPPPPHRQQQPSINHHAPPPHKQQQPPSNHHAPPHRPPSNHHPPPHQPPPNHHYTPPPYHQRPPKPPKTKRTTLASCIVATIFLTFLIIILFILYFSLFKPKDPTITITAVQLPTFTLSTNSSTVSFTFSLYAAVKNPNRAVFSHFDSSLQLLYVGNQVGFMFIPAGQISPGKTEFMAATFSVQSFPITAAAVGGGGEGDVPEMVGPPVSDGVERVKPTMELEMRLEMVGRVRVLWFFSHHVETLADCRVAVTISDGSVLGFHC